MKHKRYKTKWFRYSYSFFFLEMIYRVPVNSYRVSQHVKLVALETCCRNMFILGRDKKGIFVGG